MTHVLGAIAIVFAAAMVGYAAWWIVVLWHVLRSRRAVPRLRDAFAVRPTAADESPLVSVVIPAHNEGERIEPAVRGVLSQEGVRLQLVVVLDRCTDRTRSHVEAAAAGDPRMTIVVVDHCPADWAGKCHAAAAGARAATGTLLLFTDADVRFEPSAIARAIALASSRKADLASLLPALEVRHGFEHRWQAVASFMLMRIFPAERVNRDCNPRAFANGQFLLFTREAYQSIGGHEAVKSDLLEDIAFARLIKRAGHRVQLFAADQFVRTAMYDSAEEFRRGWQRIFIESAGRRPKFLDRLAWECLGSGAIAPAAAVAAGLLAIPAWPMLDAGGKAAAAVALGAGAIGAVAQFAGATAFLVRARGQRSSAFAWPIGAIAIAGILRSAASNLRARRPIRWGGREYVLEPRD